MAIKFISPLEKVFRDIEPKQTYFEKRAYFGEDFSMQACFQSEDTGMTHVTVETDIPEYLEVREQKFIPAFVADYSNVDDYRIFTANTSTYYPDRLDPMPSAFKTIYNRWYALWITVKAGAPIGEHYVKLAVRKDWEELPYAEASQTFFVLPQRLEKCDIPISCWLYTCGTTFLGIMSSTFLAYAVSRYEFKLKGFLYALALFVMTIPIYGSAPAYYKLIKWLQWDNSWLYLLSTAGAFGFNFIVIHSFFEGVSKEYSEAAFMDGAGHFRVFFQIMLPMAIPSIMAVVITTFIGNWNDYMTPLLYLKKMPTLASGLYVYKVQTAGYQASDHLYFAGVLISLIPVLVLFISFQNTIMEKVYAGGLKG